MQAIFIHENKRVPTSDPFLPSHFPQPHSLGFVVHGKLGPINSTALFLASRSLQAAMNVSEAKSEWGELRGGVGLDINQRPPRVHSSTLWNRRESG